MDRSGAIGIGDRRANVLFQPYPRPAHPIPNPLFASVAFCLVIWPHRKKLRDVRVTKLGRFIRPICLQSILRAGARLPAAFRCFWSFRQRQRWHCGDSIILEPGVGWEIRNVIAEVVIEAMVQRTVGNRSRPVEVIGQIGLLILPAGNGFQFRTWISDC